VSPSYRPSHERAESHRPRRQWEIRYDDYAAPELATAELRDPVARKTRRNHHSNDGRPDNYISAPRRSFSTNGDEHFGGNWHVPPIQQVAINLQSAHTPDESNPRLPSNVYHQRLREQRKRDTSRTQLPSSSSKYSTHNATKVNPEIPSKHHPALQKDDSLPRTRNFDGDHLPRHSTTSSRRSQSRSSSTSEASRGSYDTCFSTSSSLSSHSTLVPESFERQPPRQKSRYYPPDSFGRRRHKSSRGRSSSK
jgi:hypothetical protein